MTYQKQEWRNNDRSTPLSAERLNHMEEGISEAYGQSSVTETAPGSGLYTIGGTQ